MTKTRPEAFTLLEVMIAVVIFFVATISILELLTQTVRAARSLSQNSPSAGMLAADLSLTNKLEEGFASGDFRPLYPSYSWEREIVSVATNGMFRVDFVVYLGKTADSRMSVLLFRPDSPQVGTTRGGRADSMRAKPPRAAESRGFTLVEILIAMGIFMMVILAIYSTWSAILRGSNTRPGCRRHGATIQGCHPSRPGFADLRHHVFRESCLLFLSGRLGFVRRFFNPAIYGASADGISRVRVVRRPGGAPR